MPGYSAQTWYGVLFGEVPRCLCGGEVPVIRRFGRFRRQSSEDVYLALRLFIPRSA